MKIKILKEIRLARDMYQSDIAYKVGISPCLNSRYK